MRMAGEIEKSNEALKCFSWIVLQDTVLLFEENEILTNTLSFVNGDIWFIFTTKIYFLI